MADIQAALRSAVEQILSDQNYEQPPAFYRLLSDIGLTYFEIPSDQILDAIWNKRTTSLITTKRKWPGYQQSDHVSHQLIHPTVHSILRFASDAESDRYSCPVQLRASTTASAQRFSKISSAANLAAVHLTMRGAKKSDRGTVMQQTQNTPTAFLWRRKFHRTLDQSRICGGSCMSAITSSSRSSLTRNCTVTRRTRSSSCSK
jgi:hypothetical protein